MIKKKGRFLTKYCKVEQAEPTEKVDNMDGSLYAILVNGNEGRHAKDLKLIHNSLIGNGIPKKNIISLEGYGLNKSVDYPATISNLNFAFKTLRKKAKSNDRLLFYITNHGNIAPYGECNINMHGGKLWEKDFEKMIQGLPVNFGLFYFAQCYSGGFAERVGKGKNIGMSNADIEEASNGNKKKGNYFTHYLFPEILNKGTTIEQAFDNAVSKDTNLLKRIAYKETPQLRWQNADPSKLCLIS